ncbi:hypothetical protein LOTGIDRAFT_227981 [Lottia gigantea]|uniref:Laminin subunit alpha-1 n=1 Tax=Lottia gigantea TaxID=225164 RepID=V4CS81_LOTGI|nr:hypothetical protein LOTGIDRAFT_227981 [Lottia gigantea]ESP05355.1 hypothetical protein LOTGIDRAFT_227981 [Lottia gigantea]
MTFKVYQVAYVIVKAANAPRPGNWILQRSVDGITYKPWQYFALSDSECREFYGIQPTSGVPKFSRDDEVICTSRYSRLNPLENGEIFVSLINGRPGVKEPTKTLLEFTSARYIRLNLQKIRTLHADLMNFRNNENLTHLDPTVTRRYFYSIKDISVGGQCICYGHARLCRAQGADNNLQCECEHNTCGKNCEVCCPGFNQKPWGRGVNGNGNGYKCEACNCHGKASECVYNATVDSLGLSLNERGQYDGGGVCINCQSNTGGVNCETCIEGYFRPMGVPATAPKPCRRCSCRETRTSTSRCVTDDSRISEGLKPGDCICKPGFGGVRCEQCQFGFYGYPNCKPCPCNPAGSANPAICDRRCVCKENVEGRQCDRCRPGYYNLDRNNPEGCTKCFCFGVTTSCGSSDWGISQVTEMNGWVLSTRMADGLTLLPRSFNGWLEAKTYILTGSDVEGTGSWPVTQTDIHYWVAPMVFTGNRLSSYGGMLKFTIKYILDSNIDKRYHLSEPDVIIEGGGMMITNGQKYLREEIENRVGIVLHESEWRKLITVDNRLTEVPLTKGDMMRVLQSIMRVMIRATYHTAQDTVYLRDVSLDVVSPSSRSPMTLKSVEKCNCPPGYAGLSCESCSPGWRRQNGTLYNGVCLQCNCNRHSSDCDTATGTCMNCQHNTTGPNCDRCIDGFYGDPRRGSQDDCQPCACPLLNQQNNFADQCVYSPTLENRFDYQCLRCREGHTGKHCEQCAAGYYGNPMMRGGYCKPCSCSGNIDVLEPGSCNSITGECQRCRNNAEGEKCDRCKPGYYGVALEGGCTACNCYINGSYSENCRSNGECSCRPRYTGKQCDRCQSGYGDIKNGCSRCRCNRIGSVNTPCDNVSGQCRCHNGVTGLKCDRCKDGFYRLTYEGCTDCECYRRGTYNNSGRCHSMSGQCNCLPNVQGRKCDSCPTGYWGLDFNEGCKRCECNNVGAINAQCDVRNGQCTCRNGVGDRQCDRCLPGYYGFHYDGCKVCEPCNKEGHICDQQTGKCVCPPNMSGPKCEKCDDNNWGIDNITGCKPCNCNTLGARRQQCNRRTGQCKCRKDFTGIQCDQCQVGHFNFPVCDACNCNINGTMSDTCNDLSSCECDKRGQCQCKRNVEGQRCTDCKRNTFGFDSTNPYGCTECFCFGKSQTCRQAPYVWTTVSLPVQRVSISQSASEEVQYRHGYPVIRTGVTRIRVPPQSVNEMLYWSLPSEMLGDKTRSYNGKLDIIHYFETANPDEIDFRLMPSVVIMMGNGFQIYYHDNVTLESSNPQGFSIRLHEYYWRHSSSIYPISRALLMVVLQNVEAILIPATNDGRAIYAELGPIGLQLAQPVRGVDITDRALGVEICQCPEEYSGDSCQNPGDGYYREKQNGTIGNPIITIGISRPCQCYGHSDKCDSETGQCTNCVHNTTGKHCDNCAPGYYGVATRGSPWDCAPCACPLIDRSNNFSPTCLNRGGKLVCTNCTDGYEGERCERCSAGYYGNPSIVGKICQQCNCNPEGSVSPECDLITGRCLCLPGIEGDKCNQCQPGSAVQNGTCTSCYGGCTGILLIDLQELDAQFGGKNFTVPLPWKTLYKIENDTKMYRELLNAASFQSGSKFPQFENGTKFLEEIAIRLMNRVEYVEQKSLETAEEVDGISKDAADLEQFIKEMFRNIRDDAEKLEDLVKKLIYEQAGLDVSAALDEAKRIIRKIERRDFTQDDEKSKDEKWQARKLYERVKDLDEMNFNGSKVDEKIKDIVRRLEDLKERSKEAREKAKRVIDEESSKLANQIASLEDKINDAKDYRDDADLMDKINDAKDYRDDADLMDKINDAKDYRDDADLMDKINDAKDYRDDADLMDKINDAKDYRDDADLMDKINDAKDYRDDAALMDKINDAKDYRDDADLMDKINDAKDYRDDADLMDKINDAKDYRDDAALMVDDANYYIKEARDHLDRLKENYIALERKESSLDMVLNILDSTYYDLRQNLNMAEDSVRKAWQKARELDKQAQDLDRLFSKTRADAELPLRAAKVYQNIVDAIKLAENASRNALKAARDTANIANIDGLRNDVRESKEKSQRLLDTARMLQTRGLEDGLLYVQSDLKDLMMKQQSNRDMLNMINRDMDNLPKGLKRKIDEVGYRIANIGNRVDRTADQVGDTVDRINKELEPKLDKLRDIDMKAMISHIRISSKNASENVIILKNLTDIVGKQSQAAKRLNADVSGKIIRLKEKIRLARERANNMKLSLAADGECMRSYRSKATPSTANTIDFAFKLNKSAKKEEMLLLLVQKSPTEYMAVEVRNKLVYFRWNVGSGEGFVIHEQPINLITEETVEQDHWYRVTAKRIGRIGLLKVKSLARVASETDERNRSSAIGSSVLKFDSSSDVFIAGAPGAYNLPQNVTRNKFVGCIGDVKIDDITVGVFNFKTNQDTCEACVEVPSEPGSSNIYNFDGTGYSEMKRGRYHAEKIAISFSFKTYWENSILHFSGDSMGDFMSIELVDGKVVLQYYMGGVSLGKGQTKNTYNTNKWVKVYVDRKKLQALLTVDNEKIFIDAKPGLTGLDLKNSPMYFGGIPKSLSMTKFNKISTIETDGLLGCMKDVSVGPISVDLQNLFTGNYVGMSAGCKDTGVRTVGFYGNGFSMYEGQSLSSGETDISVSFVTKQPEALLLLSTDIPQSNYYSLSLKDGYVIAQFTVDAYDLQLKSNITFNDGALHNIGIIKDNKRVALMVDDKKHTEGRLPRGSDQIRIDAGGSLYLGGTPTGLTLGSNVPTKIPLDGCLSNIIINGRLIAINNPKQYSRADIGRCRFDVVPPVRPIEPEETGTNNEFPFLATEPAITNRKPNKRTTTKPILTTRPSLTTTTRNPRRTPETDKTTSANKLEVTTTPFPESTTPTLCGQKQDYGYQQGGSSFGNTKASFAQVKVKRRDVSKSFNISFEFRTYYENGLFAFITNGEQSDYIAAQLKSGYLEISYIRTVPTTTQSRQTYNDGRWHSVRITKERKDLMYIIDNRETKRTRIRAKLDIDAPIYIGGLPNNFDLKTDQVVRNSIRGCVKNVYINKDLIDLSDTKIISGVGQCYKDVERGAYFSRSSWGAYRKNVRVTKDWSIELSFRTGDKDGIIITSSSDDGQSALAVELVNGQVQFTVKNGAKIFRAKSEIDTRFKYCDVNWHMVKARILGNVIGLSIDNEEEVLSNSPGQFEYMETETPLFIGGTQFAFKDQAATSVNAGFMGCIRDIKIKNKPLDWYDLVEFGSVRRTACPIF